MNANEARLLTKQSRNCDIKAILEKVKLAASNGDSSVTVRLTDKQSKFAEEVMASLREKGYTVTRDNGYDQRDNDSWDNFNISW